MKQKLFIILFSTSVFLLSHENILSQIQDIKSMANENSNNNSGNSSSGSGSSFEDNDSFDNPSGNLTLKEFFEGCLGSLFKGFLYSKKNKSNQDTILNKVQNVNNPDSTEITDYQPIVQDTLLSHNDTFEDEKHTNGKFKFSLDIKPNFGFGYEFSSTKTYRYIDYLPGLRANLAFFLIDFRYNMLTENTGSTPDAFKSWHLTF